VREFLGKKSRATWTPSGGVSRKRTCSKTGRKKTRKKGAEKVVEARGKEDPEKERPVRITNRVYREIPELVVMGGS